MTTDGYEIDSVGNRVLITSSSLGVSAATTVQQVHFYAGYAGQVTNAGTVTGQVYLGDGGTVINNGSIATVYGAHAATTVYNYGSIGAAIKLEAGGAVVNGRSSLTTASVANISIDALATSSVTNFATIGTITITGPIASTVNNGNGANTTSSIGSISVAGVGTINNFGEVTAGVALGGGVVVNGSASDHGAVLGSVLESGLSVKFLNYGTIDAVDLSAGGQVRNFVGGLIDGAIETSGALKIGGAQATVQNAGSIKGKYDRIANYANIFSLTNSGALTGLLAEVFSSAGAFTLTNTSSGTIGAYENASGAGVYAEAGVGTITNKGVIEDLAATRHGIYLRAGGEITNGDASHAAARVEGGQNGVSISKYASQVTIDNFGTIEGEGKSGAYVGFDFRYHPGLTATIEATGTITGPTGIAAGGGIDAILNLGTVLGSQFDAVDAGSGSTITNGSAAATKALMKGAGGLDIIGSGTLTNFGVIDGTAATGFGVKLTSGAINNGSASSTAAHIEGYVGVSAFSGGTVSNYGVIAGGTGAKAIGVFLGGAGALTNSGSATISGYSGSVIYGPATIRNSGTLKATGAGHQRPASICS